MASPPHLPRSQLAVYETEGHRFESCRARFSSRGNGLKPRVHRPPVASPLAINQRFRIHAYWDHRATIARIAMDEPNRGPTYAELSREPLLCMESGTVRPQA